MVTEYRTTIDRKETTVVPPENETSLLDNAAFWIVLAIIAIGAFAYAYYRSDSMKDAQYDSVSAVTDTRPAPASTTTTAAPADRTTSTTNQ